MKIIRAVKCSTKFATQKKRRELAVILREYSTVVNFFIDYLWEKEKPSKNDLLKPIVDAPKEKTWLSARFRKVAAREAIDMILAVRERWKNKPEKITKPVHRGMRICCSSSIAELNDFDGCFDSFLKLRCMGKKFKLDIPIKKHRQFNRWAAKGKRLNSYVITPDYIQFCFEIKTEPKKEAGNTIGIDTGIKCLATTNDGQRIGDKAEGIINSINRCKHGSKRQKRLRRYLKHYINFCAKQIFQKNPNAQRIIVERLKNINFQTRVGRKASASLRKSIGAWNYRHWLSRLERNCEENCVRFTTVNPAHTSDTCYSCGHSDGTNRPTQTEFRCTKCGHADHADVNAAKNILGRGVSLVYRRGK